MYGNIQKYSLVICLGQRFSNNATVTVNSVLLKHNCVIVFGDIDNSKLFHAYGWIKRLSFFFSFNNGHLSCVIHILGRTIVSVECASSKSLLELLNQYCHILLVLRHGVVEYHDEDDCDCIRCLLQSSAVQSINLISWRYVTTKKVFVVYYRVLRFRKLYGRRDTLVTGRRVSICAFFSALRCRASFTWSLSNLSTSLFFPFLGIDPALLTGLPFLLSIC